MSFYLPLISLHYKNFEITESITALWSGCGEIVRCRLDDNACVIKAISVPDHINHPRITQTEFSINRKRHSYEVEFYWYQQYASKLPAQARALRCYEALEQQQKKVMVFADFVADGFTNAQVHKQHIAAILKWLAYFHAFHFEVNPDGLWQQGSYWHLATRPDEYEKMPDSALKRQAKNIDRILRECQYRTLIHGDAKLANFAVNCTTMEVLGYDFQYTGGGVGVVDVMYFLGSCLNEQQLNDTADDYLANYFQYFSDAMRMFGHAKSTPVVIKAWRALWPVAWTDFYRFLAGWSPEHTKINTYMRKQFQITKINFGAR
ncbi:ecdysteroid 22-kinase family protein [Pseudoalteromonas shioyasakiensis]|uniref:ecdysteroid 22-kinase family protein n=1 Tax=Pseudoalteromonas shioyasakiensis TaxID=1190813 RepID=UPI0021190A8E|nr:ecdysteroid 22-kinase family protein [Pseudoalteromonas shioyasakiensis]MCQ8878500.1 ecdysteroid 22-kinase family protein [Pseudoalteromonas shioyasakiensis]